MAPQNASDQHNSQDTLQRLSERLLKAMATHSLATRGAAVALVLAGAGAWGGLAMSRSRAQAAGFALVEAFAVKDAIPESLRAERAAKRAEAKAAAAAAKIKEPKEPKDDGDDDDEARDDDGDDGDDSFNEDAAGATVPRFADAVARDEAAYASFARLAQAHPGNLGTLAALEAVAVTDDAPVVVAPESHDPAHPVPSSKERNAGNLALLARATAPLTGHNSLMAVAALREAQLAEDTQDIDAALAAYGRVIDSQIQFLGDEARVHQARLLMGKGDLDGAHRALEDVQNNYPQTSLSDELRIQMAALEEHRAKTIQDGSVVPPAHASAG